MNSDEAEAPTAEPSQLNLREIMTTQGCKAFSDLLKATGADATFNENLDAGLTVFCPTDHAINGFMPKYKNLTAPQKKSVLLYHGIPVYQSMQMLESNNGIMNTLATDGANKYDFTVKNNGDDVVTLKTKVMSAKITGTLKDEEPLVVYKIDKVLLPRELFKTVEAADAPKASKSKHNAADGPDSDAPSGSDPADQAADNDNGVAGLDGRRLVIVLLSLCIGVLM